MTVETPASSRCGLLLRVLLLLAGGLALWLLGVVLGSTHAAAETPGGGGSSMVRSGVKLDVPHLVDGAVAARTPAGDRESNGDGRPSRSARQPVDDRVRPVVRNELARPVVRNELARPVVRDAARPAARAHIRHVVRPVVNAATAPLAATMTRLVERTTSITAPTSKIVRDTIARPVFELRVAGAVGAQSESASGPAPAVVSPDDSGASMIRRAAVVSAADEQRDHVMARRLTSATSSVGAVRDAAAPVAPRPSVPLPGGRGGPSAPARSVGSDQPAMTFEPPTSVDRFESRKINSGESGDAPVPPVRDPGFSPD